MLGSGGKPVSATTFSLNIFSAGGTVLLVSGLITAAIYRLHPRRLVRAFAGVTGSDTSVNSVFGLLQTTAAARTGISPVLLGAANKALAPLLCMGLLVFLHSTPVLGWMVVTP